MRCANPITLTLLLVVLFSPTIRVQAHKQPVGTKAASSAPATGQSQTAVPALEKVDVFYYSSPLNGSPTPMEKERGSFSANTTKVRGKAAQRTMFIFLSGEQAKLRLKHGEDLEFLVQLSEGKAIEKFFLYKVSSKDGDREMQIVGLGAQFRPAPIKLRLLKLGEIYKLTPARKLPPGEYAIISPPWQEVFAFEREFARGPAPRTSTRISGLPVEAFCFGIDNPKRSNQP